MLPFPRYAVRTNPPRERDPMNRNDAILLIQEITGKTLSESRKHLDGLIDLCEPEYDRLKTPEGEVGGNKKEHLRRMVETFHKNETGGW